jgi:hypothetical protein
VTNRQCGRCHGTGRTSRGQLCRACKGTGWVELRARRGGLPGSLTEASTLVTGPALLLAAVRVAAEREGIDATEWWRRAARVRLGWREVLDDPATGTPR